MTNNLVYFGSAQFTADTFESLIQDKSVNIVGVVTTPDRPLGRKQVLTPSPLALAAQKYDLPVYKPEKLDASNLAHIRLLKPDYFLVVAYGHYFDQNWLNAPSKKTLNIHFSLLPKYRGALCISEAILNGDKETGVTLMEMGEKLDAGPIIAQIKVPIDQEDNCQTLTTKLTTASKQLLKYELPIYLDGAVSSYPQDEAKATYTPFVKTRTRQNAFVDWKDIEKALKKDTEKEIKQDLHNRIRSNNPEPGAWTIFDNKEMKIIATKLTTENIFTLEIVQFSGKQPTTWSKINS